ncbi:hypothetical protein DFQ05_1116 [Winogradskyella wandonensis]|uniref:Uncharacterized protein n=1 Tax=Winogradskyella wandonensis TaxID=1442586 RepID=A0A4R1KQP8_9FLAO|nr:hypothetical protein [Winogradskyella wandonensis]TCK67342.1 hypothetical protein DFQ05_1116 [Winogradskyella wandonensis]
MKTFLKLSIYLFTLFSFAQTSFFETLNSHGADAEYLNFGQVYINDDGKQQVNSSKPQKTTIVLNEFMGLPAGIKVFSHFEGKEPIRRYNYDATKEPVIDFIGFPNTSMLHHGGYNRGFVAIDNYVFFLEGISKDKLDFRQISRAYVLVGTKNASSETKKKKKKKFGKFLGKLKDATINQGRTNTNAQPEGPEYDALMSHDVREMIKSYLKTMKAKQDTYVLTEKDKADLATIKNAGIDYDKMVQDKNNAYWNSAEGQEVLRRRRKANAHMETCQKHKEVCGSAWHWW